MNCHADYGCSGPLPLLGRGGCNLCVKLVINWNNEKKISSDDTSSPRKPRECMGPLEECPADFFQSRSPVEIDTGNETRRHIVVSSFNVFRRI